MRYAMESAAKVAETGAPDMVDRARGMRWHAGFVLIALAGACSPPPPRPVQSAPLPPRSGPAWGMPGAQAPPPAAPPPSAPLAATAPPPNTIVIHEADLFGEVQSRAGTTVHVLPLVATRAPPSAGVKGVLFRGVSEAEGTQWLAIAEVTVKKGSDGGSNMQLTITDEKKDALIGGRKVDHFAKGVRVKFRWEY
jgi:hypothetical protein